MVDDENVRITEKDLPQEFVLKLLGRYEAPGLWGIKNTREPVDVMVRYAKTHELSLPIVQLVVTKEGIFMSPVKCRLDNQSRDNISIRKINARYQFDRKVFANPKTPVHETWNENGMAGPEMKPCNITQSAFKQIKENCVTLDNQPGKKLFENRKPKEKKSGTPTDLQLLEKYSRVDWRKRGIFFFGIDTISYGVQDLIYTRVFSMIIVSDRSKKTDGGRSPFMCHAFVCESRSTARRVTYALAAAFQAYGRSMKVVRGIEKCQKMSREEKPKKLMVELRPLSEVTVNDSEA